MPVLNRNGVTIGVRVVAELELAPRGAGNGEIDQNSAL